MGVGGGGQNFVKDSDYFLLLNTAQSNFCNYQIFSWKYRKSFIRNFDPTTP